MWCLRCGERDPGNEAKCKKCKSDLGLPESRIGYFNQIMVLTGELLNKKLETSDYEKSLQWAAEAMDDMGKNLDPIEKQMKMMNFDELAISLMNRPIKSFREGIQTFHEGLEKLRFYTYEQNQSHLYNGLTLLEKANNLFNYTSNTAGYMIRDITKQLPEDQVKSIEKKVMGEAAQG
jgi:hypothetical protein